MEYFPADFRYTLCFLTRQQQVLMLHRRNPPNQGLWNGVGGHIETGEAPLPACLREVREETGFCLPALRFGGLLTWEGFETPRGGLYIYHAEAPAGDPLGCEEGELRWQPREWAFSSAAVVSNIHYFLPAVLGGDDPLEYHFVYQAGQVIAHEKRPLPAWSNDLLDSKR